jgi:hypothetical protein
VSLLAVVHLEAAMCGWYSDCGSIKRRIISMTKKTPTMKPVDLARIEVLKLYGAGSPEEASTLKVGKPPPS